MKHINLNKIINSNHFIFIVSHLLLFVFFEYLFFSFSKPLIISIILYFSFYAFFLGVFKNSKWAILCQAILFFIIFAVSSTKYSYTGETFYLSDILFLKNASELIGYIGHSGSFNYSAIILRLLFTFLIYIGVLVLNFSHNVVICNKKIRISLLSVAIISICILFIPPKPVYSFITEYIYDVSSRNNYKGQVFAASYYEDNGHLGGIYGIFLDSKVYKADDYNEDTLNEVLRVSKKEDDQTLGTPNIIVLFSESFWDIDKLDEVEFDRPITKNLNTLKDEGLYFEMISPSFGGTSANVEFEFLTGASLNYFGISYIPYFSLYHNSNRFLSPNIITELKRNGYDTEIVSYTSKYLFDCGVIYKGFGFDNILFFEDVPKEYQKGFYVSDEYVVNRVIHDFKNKETDQRKFYMTLTMQNHMQYTKDKYDKYDIQITKSNLNEEDNDAILSYAQGVYDADVQLERLYQFIQSYEEPTIIVFFGDHLPYIKAFEKLQYFNTDDARLNLFRKYNTQSLVLANFDISSLIQDTQENQKYLGVDILSSYLLNHMDVDISDYYQWLYTTKDVIGASNLYVIADKEGNLYYPNHLPDDMKSIYDLRRNIQYKKFIDIK